MDQQEIKNILNMLQKAYPKAFPTNAFVVLKKGIDLDICKDDKVNINRTKLRKLLRIYTLNPGYRELHSIGEKRYDLEGKSIAEVTKDDVEALEKTMRLRKKRREFLGKQKLK